MRVEAADVASALDKLSYEKVSFHWKLSYEKVNFHYKTQCQDEFRNSSGKTQNLKSPETLKERYRQVRILDLDMV